jgi:hypothetical protein
MAQIGAESTTPRTARDEGVKVIGGLLAAAIGFAVFIPAKLIGLGRINAP